MAEDDAHATAQRALVAAARDALLDGPRADAEQASRLACLLAGRERFAVATGCRPAGRLDSLPPPFADLPASTDCWEPVEDALGELRRALPDEPAPAAIGAGYEATLMASDRGERGQFVTPGPIADTLVRWALDATDDGHPPQVLDPAAGTGTFPLATLARLRERPRAVPPTQLLAGLSCVDVDPVALHLAGLRLVATSEVSSPTALSIHRASFFDCAPSGAQDADGAAVVLDPVDAVVGNPPYVRAAALSPDREHFRRHLDAFGPAGEAPWRSGDEAISRRSDAYVYFVTHATRFLRPGGRLAMVLPTKWLMSDYGEDLRRFLRGRFRVRGVVGFDARAFGEALVDTCLLFAEREDGADGGAPLRFVRAGAADADVILEAVDAQGPSGSLPSGRAVPSAGIAERSQRTLTAPGSLAAPLEAPSELLALLDGPAFARLDDLAEVARGTMTGANAFFFLDDETVERFEIDARFRRPAVRSLRWMDRPLLKAAAVERQLLAVHEYVGAVRDGRTDRTDGLERAVTDALAADGYRGLLRYVAAGERENHHTGRTCSSRPVWFDLGPVRAPAAFVPKLLRERVFCVRNEAGAIPSNAIDGLWPRDDVDPGALLAALNSSIGAAAMEATGRDEAGLLQLMTYETAALPVPDVRQLTPTDRDRLARTGALYAAEPTADRRLALDEVLVDVFDLPHAPSTLDDWARALRHRRIDGGETVGVPLD